MNPTKSRILVVDDISKNLQVVGTIFVSWLVTLPAGAFLSIVIFFILKGIFS